MPGAEYHGAAGIRRTLSMDLDKAFREAEAEKAEQAAVSAPAPSLPSAVLPVKEEKEKKKEKGQPRFESSEVD